MKLYELFAMVQNKSKHERRLKKHFDGKAFWQPIKHILDSVNISFSWKKNNNTKVTAIMNLPEFYINGFGKQIIDEKNHFIIQTVRIPLSEEPSVKKLIQIALNIGQYDGVKSKSDIKLPYTKITDFVNSTIAQTDLTTHLTPKSLVDLIKLLETH